MPAPAAALPGIGGVTSALGGLGFVGDLVGSLFGGDDDDQDRLNWENFKWQVQRDIDNRAMMSDLNRTAITEQRYRDNNAVMMRTRDAMRSGIHPLAALGMQPISSAPSLAFSPTDAPQRVSSDFKRNHGQDITRALFANMKKKERIVDTGAALDNDLTRANIDKVNAEADYYRSLIARTQANQVGPGYPDNAPKKGTSPVNFVPVDVNMKVSKGVEAGNPAEVQMVETTGGDMVPYPTQTLAEQMEGGSPIPSFFHGLRNNIAPNLGYKSQKRALPPPKPDHQWAWSYTKQAWTQVRKGSWGDKVWWMR